ncbi:MAG: hypothetical protein WB867_00075 [Candidatus Dormiibacterota bacterium]
MSASYREATDAITTPRQITLRSATYVWHDKACLSYGLDAETASSPPGMTSTRGRCAGS